MSRTAVLLGLLIAILCTGCKPAPQATENAPTSDQPESIEISEAPPDLGGPHGHPDHGPHDGDLIELGQEDYHGELVHDAAQVAIYILDGSATETLAINAAQLTLSMKHAGEVKTYQLLASPLPLDPAGRSSRFSIEDPLLLEGLEAGAEGALTVEIDGKSFTGMVSHKH